MGPGSARAAVLTAYAQSLISYKARQLCRKAGFSRSDEEDLVQELTLSLLRKADQYDPSRGASLDTFADRVVISEVKMMLRARRRHKRAKGFGVLSLHDEGNERRGSGFPLTEMIEARDAERRGAAGALDPIAAIDDHDAIKAALQGLDPFIVEIVRWRQELSVNAIHQKLGISRRQINAALEHVRRQFEEAGLRNK